MNTKRSPNQNRTLLRAAIAQCGSPHHFAILLGCQRWEPQEWLDSESGQVPAKWVLGVEAIARIPRWALRPDLFGVPGWMEIALDPAPCDVSEDVQPQQRYDERWLSQIARLPGAKGLTLAVAGTVARVAGRYPAPCDLSGPDLAAASCLSRRTVQVQLQFLQRAGYVRVVARPKKPNHVYRTMPEDQGESEG